ncbi:Eukaryotic translation initiation factor 3 subunit J [Chlorella sorokiniana]|uniref:Eukaryotic translation initiation factor 3 subunit J n=1 Tax=Chlorella sorokiniana TaxID=3076 RepID=A0A2P6TLG6_CHLSO|nr:Eukaryotic translation initiation factor 3 subunit J [Chlorella sorokiniana]|eukprot:PRW45133.1 Eukaryotic translation initiation factor 3 subunit J [Chlorella sorokiniana]
MADSWEDWENEDEVVIPGAPAAAAPEPAANKFAGEDEGEEEEPKWKANVPAPQQVPAKVPAPQQAKEKKGLSKYDESKGVRRTTDDTPLDDPVAEKLRQQRLIEESDFEAAMDLFGGSGRSLEGFIPKSAKDFDEFGRLVGGVHMLPHAKNAHYKAAIKSFLKTALSAMSAQEVKDVETCVAGIRSDRLKEEKAAQGGKKTAKKAALNVGKGGASAGLDDYIYDDAGDGDDDFM